MGRLNHHHDPNPRRQGPGGSGSSLSNSIAMGVQEPAEDGQDGDRKRPQGRIDPEKRERPPVIRQPGEFKRGENNNDGKRRDQTFFEIIPGSRGAKVQGRFLP